MVVYVGALAVYNTQGEGIQVSVDICRSMGAYFSVYPCSLPQAQILIVFWNCRKQVIIHCQVGKHEAQLGWRVMVRVKDYGSEVWRKVQANHTTAVLCTGRVCQVLLLNNGCQVICCLRGPGITRICSCTTNVSTQTDRLDFPHD